MSYLILRPVTLLEERLRTKRAVPMAGDDLSYPPARQLAQASPTTLYFSEILQGSWSTSTVAPCAATSLRACSLEFEPCVIMNELDELITLGLGPGNWCHISFLNVRELYRGRERERGRDVWRGSCRFGLFLRGSLQSSPLPVVELANSL